MTDSSLMTPEVNLFLTMLTRGGEICIREWDNEVGVWLPGTVDFDPPTGKGDSVFEALADAVHNSFKEKRKHG